MSRLNVVSMLTVLLTVVFGAGLSLQAQPLGGFAPSDDYEVAIDGTAAPGADVFFSQAAGAFLVVSRDLSSPVLVQPRSQSASGVPVMSLAKTPTGGINILDGAALVPLGAMTIDGDGASFSIDGVRVSLRQRPDLVGWKEAADIAAYKETYATLAAAYQPQAKVIEDLRARTDDVRVVVFFGSWCPFCQQKVPLVMKVADALEGSSVNVDFYGLAKSFSGDAQARKYNIRSVPTGVVFVGGKEVGRLQSDAWNSPETSLNRLLRR
jgi:thiol-disulfide isomerase/thioredoxin